MSNLTLPEQETDDVQRRLDDYTSRPKQLARWLLISRDHPAGTADRFAEASVASFFQCFNDPLRRRLGAQQQQLVDARGDQNAEFLFPRAGQARLHTAPNLGANVVTTAGIRPIA